MSDIVIQNPEGKSITIKLPTSFPAVLSLPLDPETLNRSFQGCARGSRLNVTTWRFSIACPTGVTTSSVLSLPSGWYCTRRDARIISDTLSTSVTVNVFVDGETVSPFGLPMSAGECNLDFGSKFLKKESVKISVANSSGGTINLIFEMVCNLMEVDFYNTVYQPCLEYADKLLEAICRQPIDAQLTK